MAEYDTSTANYGRADKSFAAPDLARHAGPDAGAVASAKQAATTAKALSMFAKDGMDAYAATINKDRRDAAEARRQATEARQKLARDKSLAEIRANELQLESGGKAFGELSKTEKAGLSQEPDINEIQNKGEAQPKPKLITEDEKSNKLLKDAYQRKTTEAVLKREQIEFDEASPELVTSLWQQFLDQKKNTQQEHGAEGVQEWPEYAAAKLEIYKTEQGQVYSGLPQLGAAGCKPYSASLPGRRPRLRQSRYQSLQ